MMHELTDAGAKAKAAKLARDEASYVKALEDEQAQFDFDVWEEQLNDFGEHRPIIQKMANYVKRSGDKKSKGSDLLIGEHIPKNTFGTSSDEIATNLGMTENEFMGMLSSMPNRPKKPKASAGYTPEVEGPKPKPPIKGVIPGGHTGFRVVKPKGAQPKDTMKGRVGTGATTVRVVKPKGAQPKDTMKGVVGIGATTARVVRPLSGPKSNVMGTVESKLAAFSPEKSL